MTVEPSLWSFVANASTVVKLVMLLLLSASIISWSIILQRGCFLKKVRVALEDFEEKFWTETSLSNLYKLYQHRASHLSGL